MGMNTQDIFPGSRIYHASSDMSLFSSSLPVLPHEKLNLNEMGHGYQSVDDASPSLNKLYPEVESTNAVEDAVSNAIGNLLPDDEDELLAGIERFVIDGLDNHSDFEEHDFFSSGGGFEFDSDQQESSTIGNSKVSLSDGVVHGVAHDSLPNGTGSVIGEHPLGEHPSRKLFVRNINSNVEDSELRTLFEQYGDIRTLYTAPKHRGFVIISYYDIRAARAAMRALQNKPLLRRKLDIHFAIPKENPSEKDINQGTLVVFNLDPSVSSADLHQIFGVYGEIKEIRETPHKRNHKFIEFYDVRSAEAALRSLNRTDIAGKRIKVEPSRPGGARRSLMLQLNHEFEQDDPRTLPHQMGSPIGNSPRAGNWQHFGSPVERGSFQSLSKSSGFTSLSAPSGNSLSELASVSLSKSPKMAVGLIGKEYTSSNQRGIFEQSNPFQDKKSGLYSSDRPTFSASSSNGSQFLWGSPQLYQEHMSSSPWRPEPVRHPFMSNGRHGVPYANHSVTFYNASQHHNHHLPVGSAPSGVSFKQQLGFHQASPETSFMSPGLQGSGGDCNNWSVMINTGDRAVKNGGADSRNAFESGSSGFSSSYSPRLGSLFFGNGHFPGPSALKLDQHSTDSWRFRRTGSSVNQIDNKEQFQLDLTKIRSGEDTRTTLMIKNIPNKYTSKMLLATIDEHHKGTYDFLYLPIDFKNKCNMGYAFINMSSSLQIIPFYESFNGKKWEKFNSEKVTSLAYARIQGKSALVAHFQNSNLMTEDKRCRPMLFHLGSSESGDQQLFQGHSPSGNLSIQISQSNGLDPRNPPGSMTVDRRPAIYQDGEEMTLGVDWEGDLPNWRRP